MTRGKLITGTLALAIVVSSAGLDAQDSQPVAAFKSSVDLVRVTAVVRDRKGRFVQDLKPRDFEVVDDGRSRSISDLQADTAGVSVAVLFDVSGSMEGHMTNAREAATQVLSWLDASRDEAAIYTFDTRLDERAPFTTGLKSLPASIERVVPFGATSLHDAIAQTAQRVCPSDARSDVIRVFSRVHLLRGVRKDVTKLIRIGVADHLLQTLLI